MKVLKSAFLFSFLLICGIAFAQPVPGRAPLNITEEDASPSTFPYKLKVTNGTLTDNGDGTASLTTGGGGSSVSVSYPLQQSGSNISLSVAQITNGAIGFTGVTDDTAIIADGTAWKSTSVPNCTDAGGNHINYTQATNSFSCGTSSSSSATPGGSGTQVQFNDSGSFAGDSGFVYNKTTDSVILNGSITVDTTTLVVESVSNNVGIGTSAPGQQLEVTKNIKIPASTTTAGNIYKGTSLFLSSFGNGGDVDHNTFLGIDAGNLTLTGTNNTGLGNSTLNALSSGANNIAIGYAAGSGITTTSRNIIIGSLAGDAVNANDQVLIGDSAGTNLSSGTGNVMVGSGAGATPTTSQNIVLLGNSSNTSANNVSNAVAVGNSTTVNSASIVLGQAAASTSGNQFVVGSQSFGINDFYLGQGVTAVAPSDTQIDATSGDSGTTNDNGANLVIASGGGRGVGLGGSLLFKTYTKNAASGVGAQAIATRMVIKDHTGSVGIGTTTPAAKLEVNGGIKITGGATDDTVLLADGAQYNGSTIPDCTDAGGNHINYTQSTNAFSCGTSGASTSPGGSGTQVQFNDSNSFNGDSGFVYNKTSDSVIINGGITVDTTTFIVDPTANNVGIGTSTPSAPLEISTGVTGQKTFLKLTNTFGAAANTADIDFKIGGAAVVARIGAKRTDRGTNSDTDITFSNLGSNSFLETMRIMDNGNVGVGTSFPGAKLEVKGGIKITNGATDDTVLLANGTQYNGVSVPDCTDSSGNHINYTASSNSFSCGTTSSTSSVGSGTQIIFNDNGTLAGDSGLVYNKTTDTVTVNGGYNIVTSTGTNKITSDTVGIVIQPTEQLTIPQGGSPQVNVSGQFALDTTYGQLIYVSNDSVVKSLSYDNTRCAIIQNVSSLDTNIPLGSFDVPITLNKVWCTCTGTCTTMATVTLADGGGNSMTISGTNPVCTVMGSVPVPALISGANASLNSYESFKYTTSNTPSPATDTYELCVGYTYDRQ